MLNDRKTVVRESYDFSCVVTDAAGNALAQATQSIPSFIGTLPATVKHFIAAFPPDGLSPGDVLITNDPYMGTGHLPDISVCRPLFSGSKLVGFAASTAHAPDIGGKIRSPEPREIYEEGLQIPLLKLHEAGVPNQTLMSILRKNVRMGDQVEGDLEAQLGALAIMERRIDELIETYGLTGLRDLSHAVRRRTETAVREAHSLKGLAASLGVTVVSERAAAVEAVLVDRAPADEVLAGLRLELAMAMEHIRAALQTALAGDIVA